ncbi:sensor domain-containing diguanylate cyclase [Paracholeplasma brassicae]|nr:GGDEF domain-containing protein [Paracholeplasma brassicae]
MKRHIRLMPILIMLSYVLFFSLLIVFDRSSNEKLTIETVNRYDDTLIINGTPYEKYPEKIESKLPIEIDLDMTTFKDEDFLLLRTSLQDLFVYIDGVLVYSKSFNNENHPYASLWHVIEISEGETLTLVVYSPYESMNGLINDIHYGTLSEIYAYIFQSHGLQFLMGILLNIIGLFIIVISFMYYKNERSNYVYFGITLLLISYWIVSESRLLQFIIGSPDVLGSLSYITLGIISIPMLYFFKLSSLKKYDLVLNVMISVSLFVTVMMLVLQFSGLAGYFESVIFAHITMILEFIVVVGLLLYEWLKKQSNEAKKSVRVLGVFLIFVLAEFIYFLIGRFNYTSWFVIVGFLFVSVFMLYDYLKYINVYTKKVYEASALEKLAYTDYLTGANNRLSFEKRLEENLQSIEKNLYLFYFDLDHLKEINDTYGHNVGDEAIIQAYGVITQVFQKNNCFRIGGDEFSCVLMNLDEASLNDKIVSLKEGVTELNLKSHYQIDVSIGYAMTTNEMKSQALMKLADDQMYENKRNKRR